MGGGEGKFEKEVFLLFTTFIWINFGSSSVVPKDFF